MTRSGIAWASAARNVDDPLLHHRAAAGGGRGRGLKSEPPGRAANRSHVPAFCGIVCWTSADFTVCQRRQRVVEGVFIPHGSARSSLRSRR